MNSPTLNDWKTQTEFLEKELFETKQKIIKLTQRLDQLQFSRDKYIDDKLKEYWSNLVKTFKPVTQEQIDEANKRVKTLYLKVI